MKITTRLLIGAGTIAAVTGVALATPVVGTLSPLLAVGKQNKDVNARGSAPTVNGEEFKARLETEGAATMTTQLFSVAAGGHNGWHSHPGLVAVTLISGTIQWYDENCVPTVYTAGDSWVEGSQPHAYRVVGTNAIQAVAWFITAQGQPYRTDLPAPACGASLGL